MDVHQALDWVNALSEAESGLSDVSWVDSGSLFHGHCTLYVYKFNLSILSININITIYLPVLGKQ